MKWLSVIALIACVGCASPLAPSASVFVYPSELADVIRVIDEDPWIHPLLGEPMGVWLRKHVTRIDLDGSLAPEFGAYTTGSVIRWAAHLTGERFSLNDLAGLLLHEARHAEGFRHTCPDQTRDRTLTEGGPHAVQILYLDHAHSFEQAAYQRRFIGCS